MERLVKLLAACVLVMFGLAGPQAEPALGFDGNYLDGTATTKPPLGYVRFCRESPDQCVDSVETPRFVELTPGRARELERINTTINRTIRPVTDIKLHGVAELWSYPTGGSGDCEDYVLEKRRELIALGWPRQALLITVVLDARGDGHAVLTARTSQGDLVLDNQAADVKPWYRTGYRFVKRQAEWNTQSWVAIAPRHDAGVVTAANAPPPR